MDGQPILPRCCNRSSQMTDPSSTSAHSQTCCDRLTSCEVRSQPRGVPPWEDGGAVEQSWFYRQTRRREDIRVWRLAPALPLVDRRGDAELHRKGRGNLCHLFGSFWIK